MKKVIGIIVILLVICSFSLANAFQVKLKNTTEYPLDYTLTWLQCPWEGFDGKADMSGGLLQAWEEFTLTRIYDPGPYLIIWKDFYPYTDYISRQYSIRVPNKEGILIITPVGMKFYPENIKK